jgi:hypothetical protein
MQQRGKKKFSMASQRGVYKVIRSGCNPSIWFVSMSVRLVFLFFIRLHPIHAVRVQDFQR